MRNAMRVAGLAVLVACAAGAAAEEAKEDREVRREHDAAVREAIETFKKALRDAKAPQDRALAVKRLAAEEKDAKIIPELARMTGDADPVRIEALAGLAAYRRDKLAAMSLVGALSLNAKNVPVLAKNLEALGDVGFESTIPIVAKFLRHEEDAASTAAAKAMGGMNSAMAVEALIAYWEELDRGRKKGGDTAKKAGDRLLAVGPMMKDALTRLTGKKYHYADEHRAWWTQNKASYEPREEPPPALCRHFGAPAPAVGPVAGGGAPAPAAPPVAPPPAPAPGEPAAPKPPVPPPIPGVFFRGFNLNGPSLEVEGCLLDAGIGSPDFAATGGTPFASANGPVVPSADPSMSRMLRTGLTSTGALTLTVSNVPAGAYLVRAYFWEDSAAEMFDVKVQGALMASNFSTGGEGRWGRIGPWPAVVTDGTLVLACSGGAVSLSGLEIWKKPEAPPPPPDAAPGAGTKEGEKAPEAKSPDGEPAGKKDEDPKAPGETPKPE